MVEFDPYLAPAGFIAVQLIPTEGQQVDTMCKGCAFDSGKEHAGMCWMADCAPWSRPDESHAIFEEA